MAQNILLWLDKLINLFPQGWIGDELAFVIKLLFVAIIAILAYYLVKVSLSFLERIILNTPTDWDDDLLNNRMFKAVSHLAPALAVSGLLPALFVDYPAVSQCISVLTTVYIIVTIARILLVFLDNLYRAVARRENLKAYAVKGVFQMVKLLIIAVSIIGVLAELIGKSPVAILTAVGASAAVLSLVFKDTILGFVASVQLTANNMLHRGDWIIQEKCGANGVVEDVTLTTVKVKNWDNTITTIPPYTLISESFTNYAPMWRSGGRRVYRAIYIDANTVGFLSPEQMTELREKGMVEEDCTEPMVNLTLLRRYLTKYLKTDSRVNQSMTIMVRQLDPTPNGLPLQLYFFTATTDWVEFETIQADIFDYIYATIQLFGLKIYQLPTSLK